MKPSSRLTIFAACLLLSVNATASSKRGKKGKQNQPTITEQPKSTNDKVIQHTTLQGINPDGWVYEETDYLPVKSDTSSSSSDISCSTHVSSEKLEEIKKDLADSLNENPESTIDTTTQTLTNNADHVVIEIPTEKPSTPIALLTIPHQTEPVQLLPEEAAQLKELKDESWKTVGIRNIKTSTEEVTVHWPKREGWKKPEDFTQYIEHNVEQDSANQGRFKKSSIITSSNTEPDLREIKHTDKNDKVHESKYIAQKWFYPKAQGQSTESRLLEEVDESVRNEARNNPSVKELEEKTAYSQELLHDIRKKAFDIIVDKSVMTELNKTPENTQVTDEFKAMLEKEIRTTLTKSKLPLEYIFESPKEIEFPEILFTSEQPQTLQAPTAESVEKNQQDSTRVYGTKTSPIIIDATGNNALDASQTEYLINLVELLNNPNVIVVDGKLIDISTVGQRKKDWKDLPNLAIPNLPVSKIAIGVYNALGTLRNKTLTFRDDFLAKAGEEQLNISKAFETYHAGTPEKSSLNEAQRLAVLRRAYALVASAHLENHADNYSKKRDLLVVAQDVEVASMLGKAPHESTTKSVLGWLGLASSTRALKN